MKSITYRKHVKRAKRIREHANRQRGALSSNEKLIGFVDRYKQQLTGEDRALALDIMANWLRTGWLSFEHRSNLRRLRRQIRSLHEVTAVIKTRLRS